MKDLLNYLKISTAWQSAFERDYQPNNNQYQDYYLHINGGDQICLNLDLNYDCVRLLLEDCNGELIANHSMHFDVKRNENNIINYLKTLEG